MKPVTLRACALAILALSGNALSDPVTYQIGPYSGGGYSASWLHEATHCSGSTGAHTGQTLYMCDRDPNPAVTGTLSGDYDAITGVLTIAAGQLNISGMGAFSILGGSLGGAFDDGTAGLTGLNWFIDIAKLGTFYFEDIGMGPSGPNFADGDELILWGQNTLAYCDPAKCGSNRWGLDLYGRKVSVNEPGTLALLGLALLGLATAQRRRIRVIA